VTKRAKHTSLLCYKINYAHKKFYVTCPKRKKETKFILYASNFLRNARTFGQTSICQTAFGKKSRAGVLGWDGGAAIHEILI
jgi:hypothetical protein